VIKVDGEHRAAWSKAILGSRARLRLRRDARCSEFDSAAHADATEICQRRTPTQRTYRHDLGSIDVYWSPMPQHPPWSSSLPRRWLPAIALGA